MTKSKQTNRSLLVLVSMMVILAACGADVASPSPVQPSPSSPATPTVQPSEQPIASPRPSASPRPIGILTIADGINPDGPGRSLADVLDGDLSQPVFVRGVLFRAADGSVFLADRLVDPSVPIFSEIRVRVENFPSDGPTWDMTDADVTGLKEVNGIRFYPEGNPFYGTIRQA